MCTFYLLATEPGLKADNDKDDDDGNYDNDDGDDKNLVVFVARQKRFNSGVAFSGKWEVASEQKIWNVSRLS